MQNFVDGINEIHNALIEHSDVHPRNMMIIEDDPERAIWIDFDWAQTFKDQLTELRKKWIVDEKVIVGEMAEVMVSHLAPFVNGRFAVVFVTNG